MNITRIVALLARAGLTARVESPRVLRVTQTGQSFLAEVSLRSNAPAPSEIVVDLSRSTTDLVLYAPGTVTKSLVEAANDDIRLVVVSLNEARVIFRGHDFDFGGTTTRDEPLRRRGRYAWGRHAVERVLLRTARGRTQTELAIEAGVTQTAVSQGLKALGTLCVRTSDGWTTREPAAIWESFLTKYPGPRGLSETWFGVGPVTEQARQAVTLGTESSPLVSGDVGADELAPWRRGRRVILYGSSGAPLERAFAESDAEEATLDWIVPDDPTIAATAAAWHDPSHDLPLADPMIVAWDVLRIGGPDAAEAVDHLRERTLRARESNA